MNKYALFYFDITQNRDIKDTLYKTLTTKEKKNFIRDESKNVKKNDDYYDQYKLDKFSMKIIELLLVLAMPIFLNLILILIIFITNLFTNDYQFNIIEMNNLFEKASFYIYFIIYFSFIVINILNIEMICNYYGVKYNCIKHYYSYYENNYVYHFVMNKLDLPKIYDLIKTIDVRNKINYKLHALYNKLQYLKPNYLKSSISHYENKLIDKFNTLYIDKEATHLMYEYELMKNIELLNNNESTKDLYQIVYEIDDNYIEVNKLLDEQPDSKDNDHLIALIESIKLNKTEIKSFEKLVKLLQNKIGFEYYSQKINLLDDEREKMEKAEKRLNDIYQIVYELDDNQVNAYDLRIKELEKELKDLKQQLN